MMINASDWIYVDDEGPPSVNGNKYEELNKSYPLLVQSDMEEYMVAQYVMEFDNNVFIEDYWIEYGTEIRIKEPIKYVEIEEEDF